MPRLKQSMLTMSHSSEVPPWLKMMMIIDGWTDSDEASCGTDPLDVASVPYDGDGNGICDVEEGGDTDGDGVPDLSDSDDDNDGVSDEDEILCGSDPKMSSDTPPDMDSGWCMRCTR